MKALIVEDSRLARLELNELLKSHPEITVVAEAVDADMAEDMLAKHDIDVIFLDIQMPGRNGFEFLESLEAFPPVIFTTAYDAYAIRSFEYNALDYLLKPIHPDRLAKAIKKLTERPTSPVVEETYMKNSHQIFIKDGENCWLVALEEISLFESCGNYTRVYFRGQKALVYKSLNQIEKRLDPQQFFRANRQQMIQIQYIKEVQPWFKGYLKLVLKNGEEVEISRRQSGKFKNLFSF